MISIEVRIVGQLYRHLGCFASALAHPSTKLAEHCIQSLPVGVYEYGFKFVAQSTLSIFFLVSVVIAELT